jgi:hypothetical protein
MNDNPNGDGQPAFDFEPFYSIVRRIGRVDMTPGNNRAEWAEAQPAPGMASSMRIVSAPGGGAAPRQGRAAASGQSTRSAETAPPTSGSPAGESPSNS